jgi:hypothetical protein
VRALWSYSPDAARQEADLSQLALAGSHSCASGRCAAEKSPAWTGTQLRVLSQNGSSCTFSPTAPAAAATARPLQPRHLEFARGHAHGPAAAPQRGAAHAARGMMRPHTKMASHENGQQCCGAFSICPCASRRTPRGRDFSSAFATQLPPAQKERPTYY